MATCNTEYFIGNGKVFVAPRASAGAINGPWSELGDTSKLAVDMTQSFTDIYESCSGNNNIAAHVITQTDYKFSVDALSFSKANLARALYGTASAVVGASVVDEVVGVAVAAGDIMFTKHPSISAVSVKGGSTNAVLVAGTDYTVDLASGQITILSLTAMTAPYTVKVSYTYAGYDKVASSTVSQAEYAFRFVGVNKVTGKQVVVDIHRVALDLTAAIQFIGNDKQVFTLGGMVLPDAYGAVGDSQFVTIRKAA